GNYILDSVQMLNKSSATFVTFSTVTIAGTNAFFDGNNSSTATVKGIIYGGSFISVTSGTISTQWGDTGNPTNVSYTLELSTSSDYIPTAASSTTYNRNATITSGLSPFTTYYARVKASGYAILYPSSGYVIIGSTVTNVGGPPITPQFTGVFVSSMNVS